MKMAVSVLVLLLVCTSAFGQTLSPDSAKTPAQFKALARGIEAATQAEYLTAREKIARTALAVAENDLATSDAESLLHWILSGNTDSPAAHRAAKHVIEHHGTSPASVRKLLFYAQHPSGCTPELFAGFSEVDLPDELGWIVSACNAIHQKSLLLIADEIAAHTSDVSGLQLTLGKKLLDKLADEDLSQFESRVIEEFKGLAGQHGDRDFPGMTVQELCDGSIFAVRHLRLGKKSAGLSGESFDGTPVNAGDYRGKVVLVNFWATWCAPCVMAVSELRKLRDDLAGLEFVIVGVCADSDKVKLSQFVDQHKVNWTNIFDRRGDLQKRWQVLSLPSYYVLDRDGVVRYRGDHHGAAAVVVRSILGVQRVGSSSEVSIEELARTILESLDADGNQRVERSEMPTDMQNQFSLADMDKNGWLSLAELTKFLGNGKVTTEVVRPAASPQSNDRNPPPR